MALDLNRAKYLAFSYQSSPPNLGVSICQYSNEIIAHELTVLNKTAQQKYFLPSLV